MAPWGPDLLCNFIVTNYPADTRPIYAAPRSPPPPPAPPAKPGKPVLIGVSHKKVGSGAKATATTTLRIKPASNALAAQHTVKCVQGGTKATARLAASTKTLLTYQLAGLKLKGACRYTVPAAGLHEVRD